MENLWDELEAYENTTKEVKPAPAGNLWDELEAYENQETSVSASNTLDKMAQIHSMGSELSGVTDYNSNPNEPTVSSDGTISTISTGQPEIYDHAFKENVVDRTADVYEGMGRGSARPALGIAYLGEGVYNKLTTSQSKITDGWIKENEAWIKDKGLEGPALAGEIISNILLSGISAGSSAAGVATREAAIAGTSSIGADRSALDTGIAMMLGGGIGGVVQAVLNKLNKTQIKKLYDYMLEQYNIDPITAEKNFAEWKRTTGESNSIENRVKSLVDSLGDEGATIKREIAHDPVAVKNLNKRVKETKESVEELAKGNFNVETFADDLDTAYTNVGTKYKEVKEQISSVPVDKRFEKEPWEALDEATIGDVKELKNLIGEDNPYINSKDLVEAMPIINKLIRRSKGKTLHKWSEVSKAVDTQLKDVLTESQYKLWKETNGLYSKMASVRESKLGNLIATAKGKSFKGNPKSTPEEVLAKLAKVNAGDDTFTNIVTLVGRAKTEELEKDIISSALKEDKAWKTISKNLRNKGFISSEGKRLQNIVNEFQTVFKTDDAMRVLNTNIGHEGASIATTAEGKAAVWVINKLANMVRKHIPFSATAKHLRKLDTLEEVLRSPTQSTKLSDAFESLPQSVKDEIGTSYITKLQEEIKKEQAIKHIDYKPQGIDKPTTTKTRVDYIKAANKADKDYISRIKNLQKQYMDPTKNKVQNLKLLRDNKDYIDRRNKLTEEFSNSYPINLSEKNKADWLAGAKEIPELYHGTSSDITAFDASKGEYSVHNVEGIYTTINPTDAEQYANKGRPSANIMPLIGRDEKLLDVQRTGITKEVAEKFGLADYKLQELKLPSGKYNLMSVLKASKLSNKENTEILKSFGATGLKDGGHYIFFNPTDIKGRFNSGRFSESKDLINSVLGGSILVGGAKSKEI